MTEGKWPDDDIRRVFVAGAKWCEYEIYGCTMWDSDIRLAEKEAEKRYPGEKIAKEAVR